MFFFKQRTAYEMRISDWSSDVCSSDLWGTVIERGWPSQSWLTFRQALAAGGAVRKGERGTTVVYADRFTPEAEKERARQTGGDAKSIAFLKRFTLFKIGRASCRERVCQYV